ncbi:hypothetical protein A6V39_04265 [Candidatus Mycoplasma haematobovis]|uniref:Uncharacterized protein n=1 Tax=Candidatus Mycoplasma haematobovis TaxID=432608 RepID=A0A1A9QDM3_9MOLU|nr:hypothetical protein [Candidatus Mycoplasma haematobovis]OAL10101.1 hypothetical protein A6V39_04265 [Candidatus Mycoplasma haematobovis]
MSSYVYFSLKREQLISSGKGIGYRFVDKYYPPDKAPEIFNTIFTNNQTKIKKLLKISSGKELQGWCQNATKGKWESDSGKVLMHGLKWCSLPVHVVLLRKSNKLDETKFGKLFQDVVDSKIELFVKERFPNLWDSKDHSTQENKAKLLRGVVAGFCKESLSDAWTFYYESQRNAIDSLCPEGT